MKRSPEELEQLIHQTLRSLPDRRAPRSLEARVLAALETRQTLPWWRQSFMAWPLPVRCLFIVLSAGAVALLAGAWMMYGAERPELSHTFAQPLALLEGLRSVVRALADFGAILVRSIPSAWIYGALACFAGLYVTLFGLGATAYRALYANR